MTFQRKMDSERTCQGLIVTKSKFDFTWASLQLGTDGFWQLELEIVQNFFTYDASAGSCIQNGMSGAIVHTQMDLRFGLSIEDFSGHGRLEQDFRRPVERLNGLGDSS